MADFEVYVDDKYTGYNVLCCGSEEALAEARHIARDLCGVTEADRVSVRAPHDEAEAFGALIESASRGLTPEQQRMTIAELIMSGDKPTMPKEMEEALRDLGRFK